VGATEDRIGQTLLGKLRVEGLLGEGGMGAVYRVHHLLTKHDRALKVLHPALVENERTVARFIREAGVAGTLQTDHVVETYDVGTLEDGGAYVLMELLEGETLRELLARERVAPRRLVGLVCQACEGVVHAHAAGIVHRDIKPDNLFVTRNELGEERIKILDFGISKFYAEPLGDGANLTKEGTILGTPFYMSPEQAVGKADLGPQTDIYSLGVILYEGLSGETPYSADTFPALVVELHKGDHIALSERVPGIAAELSEIIERALRVEPTERQQSAQELLLELTPFAGSAEVKHLRTLPGAGAPRPRRGVGELSMADTMEARPPARAETMEARPRTAEGPSTQEMSDALVPRRTWLPWALVVALIALAGVGAAVAFGGRSVDAVPVAPPPAPVRAEVEPPEDPAPREAPEATHAAPTIDPAGTPVVQPAVEPAVEPARTPRGASDDRPVEPARGRYDITRDNPY
jgi:serine/threonine-protein kinase